jgi:hypothetical protein
LADWTEFPPSVFLPGEPITSPQGLGLFENPVAIAEGAVDAPRIDRRALLDDGYLTDPSSATVNVWVDVLDLDRAAILGIKFLGAKSGATGSTAFQLGLSNNNGSSWGADISLGGLSNAGDTIDFDVALNLDTGAFRGFITTKVVSDISRTLTNQTFTVPSGGANAIRLRQAVSGGSTGNWSALIYILAGRQTF